MHTKQKKQNSGFGLTVGTFTKFSREGPIFTIMETVCILLTFSVQLTVQLSDKLY